MSQFLDMGGYAWYVWPAYAVTFVVVALNVVWARRLLGNARAAARRRLAERGEGA
ncbi:MAG TPA: heme exporter protein CcmD [Steroidobacteraceae bacterium]|jgi:heme exporter protein CcmD|nr:heme exporter protein CcmD [Steroidobacteraceae bacterium]